VGLSCRYAVRCWAHGGLYNCCWWASSSRSGHPHSSRTSTSRRRLRRTPRPSSKPSTSAILIVQPTALSPQPCTPAPLCCQAGSGGPTTARSCWLLANTVHPTFLLETGALSSLQHPAAITATLPRCQPPALLPAVITLHKHPTPCGSEGCREWLYTSSLKVQI